MITHKYPHVVLKRLGMSTNRASMKWPGLTLLLSSLTLIWLCHNKTIGAYPLALYEVSLN